MFLLSNELHPEYTAHKNVLATASAIYLKEILQAVVLIYELQTGVLDLLARQELLVIFTNRSKVGTGCTSSIELTRINFNLTYLEMSLS